MTHSHQLYEPPLYHFRVRILGGGYAPENARDIWRDIAIASNQSLAELGDAIPLAFDFNLDHMWSFFMNGKAWDEESEYAIDDPATEEVAIGDLSLPGSTGKKEFLFVYDYGDEWHFGVKLTGTSEEIDPGVDFPFVTTVHGDAPTQYPELDEEWDEEDVEWDEDEEFD